MSPEKQRIAIATACGWTDIRRQNLYAGDRDLYGNKLIGAEKHRNRLPDYPSDLNACHEMEKVLTEKGVNAWWSYVAFINRHNPRPFGTETAVHATAPQRCEAFLRTLELWEKEVNTTKSASPTSPAIEQADHETAEEKVAWLTEILVTKSCDPVFADYWLRLARRNLLLGLPLKTEEPDLNLATEESSATSCGQNPLHPRENCSWWQIGRCPTDCVHSATRLDL